MGFTASAIVLVSSADHDPRKSRGGRGCRGGAGENTGCGRWRRPPLCALRATACACSAWCLPRAPWGLPACLRGGPLPLMLDPCPPPPLPHPFPTQRSRRGARRLPAAQVGDALAAGWAPAHAVHAGDAAGQGGADRASLRVQARGKGAGRVRGAAWGGVGGGGQGDEGAVRLCSARAAQAQPSWGC